MTKHTPGPWTVEMDVLRDGDITICASDQDYTQGCPYLIADVEVLSARGNDDGPPREEAISNAHLIASAPDLAEALEYVKREASVLLFDAKRDLAAGLSWAAREATADSIVRCAEGALRKAGRLP